MSEPFLDASVAEDARRTGFREELLVPVYELNELFVETLVQAAQHPAWAGSSWQDALGMNLSEFPQSARTSLARTPICLLDVGLREVASRQLGHVSPSHEGVPAFLASDRRLELTQITLSLAWTMARTDSTVASIVFALPTNSVKVIASWKVHAIPTLAEQLASEVRPVWLSQPRIWPRLFSTADSAVLHRLPPIRVRMLQRQFADLVPATPASRSTRTSHP